MLPFLRSLAWLACLVYCTIPFFWLAIHPFASYWRSHQRNPYKVLLPLWITMWVAAGAITWRWHQLALYQKPWSWGVAVLFFAAGVWLYIQSRRGFSGQQLGGVPELIAGQRQHLVTAGVRNRVRHPVYLGHLCEMLGWSIGSGLAVNYVLTLVALVTGSIMIPLEEKELEERFGDDYRSYKQAVPAVLPRIFADKSCITPPE
jgi:protein-S-isoprenylcysteine O-methyltransferase Ste14